MSRSTDSYITRHEPASLGTDRPDEAAVIRRSGWFSYDRRATTKESDLTFSADELDPLPELDNPDAATSIGRTIVIKGDIVADEHLIIEGRVEGRITLPEHGLSVGKHGCVNSEVLAQTITVLGQATGKLTATERVELLKNGRVEGRIVTETLIVDEGALFNGTVDPTLTDTVVAVSRHRLKRSAGRD